MVVYHCLLSMFHNCTRFKLYIFQGPASLSPNLNYIPLTPRRQNTAAQQPLEQRLLGNLLLNHPNEVKAKVKRVKVNRVQQGRVLTLATVTCHWLLNKVKVLPLKVKVVPLGQSEDTGCYYHVAMFSIKRVQKHLKNSQSANVGIYAQCVERIIRNACYSRHLFIFVENLKKIECFFFCFCFFFFCYS